jgi:hypothetical protein
MAQQKIIAVVGATGAQGGGLVRAIQHNTHGEYRARAITRDVNSPKAKELAALGAEVVSGDVDDEESLKRAFDGAHGAYCVTFYWAHFSPEKEFAEAGNVARAAKQAGVSHVIWSTLEDTRRWIPLTDNRMPTLMGKYKVPHFDAKGQADHLFADAGAPTTNLLTAFYWAEDIGPCAYGVFRAGSQYIGKTIGIAAGHLTGSEMAAAFTQALGQDVVYNAVPPEVYRSFGFPGADDLGNMFQFKHDFNDYYCGARDLDFTRKLNPELQTFGTWLERNKERIPLG